VRELKSGVRFVLWLASALVAIVLAIKAFLYASILLNDGASVFAAQIKSDSVDILWFLLSVSILSLAIMLLAKLVSHGWHSINRSTSPGIISCPHRPSRLTRS
jgi:hypothetical protein